MLAVGERILVIGMAFHEYINAVEKISVTGMLAAGERILVTMMVFHWIHQCSWENLSYQDAGCRRENLSYWDGISLNINAGEKISATGMLCHRIHDCRREKLGYWDVFIEYNTVTVCNRISVTKMSSRCLHNRGRPRVYRLLECLFVEYMVVGERISVTGLLFHWIHGFWWENPGY